MFGGTFSLYVDLSVCASSILYDYLTTRLANKTRFSEKRGPKPAASTGIRTQEPMSKTVMLANPRRKTPDFCKARY